jgi:F420-0:gamma-glutamyl ligase
MKITSIQTEAVRANEMSLLELIDRYVTQLADRSIVAISSKVVSLCEGNVVKVGEADVQELARREAQYYLAPANEYGYALTINRDILISKEFSVQVGVIVTDSRVTPMRRGVLGVGLAHSGFSALQNLVGRPDIFGQYELKYTYSAVLDGLAAAVTVQMGEADQRTPIVIVEEADFVEFQDRNPTAAELKLLSIPLEEDLYAEMLKAIPWDKRPEKN